ncbi:hypothetical protein [Pediococcus claussenii]|uniref:Prophage Lp1 protein n=1 Tax=Pediococcus claussenii (strain ATCC BAA-344 / DSM 14800 / JCM 18046 / KCTC 3811 / LMG 21948 / P06) TaxID=701521 RepID=G8PD09_PEDCP|nr:hypothetical protein [Pediococcus claussenii]AEV95144.1 Prophage Lp1 protein [Pediococcus claussenii ATCC BAA-344]ANZ70327.1 hypothetical protein AYR57_08360 [Pediococcus claussenii]ANZ72143.1 hypothetical protein AYR58_08360 [Pediococcus claussenii]KRN19673.1 hypothetical protein IV79_GL001391 [Pediococcus claussenii]
MKTKPIALTNGIVGLVGGIILLFGVWFIAGCAIGDDSGIGIAIIFLAILKIAILTLGIIGVVYYKGDLRIGTAPDVLLIVGGAIALIPFLGWIGRILAIIGGSLFLTKLKNFK